MLIFKNHQTYKKNFFKVIIIIFQIINLFMMTSCSLIDFQKNNIISFDEKKNQFKTLIVPKGITIPKKNKAYDIPYEQRDLEGENYNIFPPV